MTEFRPLSPKQALELANAAEVADAERLIRDFAAAGLVKSYAAVVDTIPPEGGKTTVRDATLPTDLWDRLIEEGRDCDVWTGGTVRLPGAELVGGKPAVKITAIGFNPSDLARMIDRHLGKGGGPKKRREPQAAPAVAAPTPIEKSEAAPPHPVAKAKRPAPDPTAIPPGAILCTIKQAGEALGFGRTKVNELMNAGQLERREVNGAVRITVESVRAAAGLAG